MAERMDDTLRERLKAALWYNIGRIVDEETVRLNTNATPQFIGALTEMVWSQIENVAIDLESFSRHANRSTIQPSDVLLITRRNEALHGIIQDFIDKNAESSRSNSKAKSKSTASKSATDKPRGRPKKS